MNGSPLVAKFRLLKAASTDSRLTAGADFKVLIAVLDRMGDDLQSWPGFGRIAEDTGTTRRTVISAVNRLVDFGYLVKIRGTGRRSNRYSLGSVETDTSAKIDTSADIDTSAKVDTGVVQESSPSVVQKSAPELVSLNQSQELGKRAAPSGAPPAKPKSKKSNTVERPDDIDPQTWSDFLDFRREKKANLTPTAWKRIRAELDKGIEHGHKPDDMIAEAMAAGWQGFKFDWYLNRTRGSRDPDEGPRPPSRRYLN